MPLLANTAPALAEVLRRSAILTPARFGLAAIRCETTWVAMRDGVRLATDLYFPPVLPAPTVVLRTPYGRSGDVLAGAFISLARRGYVGVTQDCRGTGESEPDSWDFYMYEPEDSYDLVEWISGRDWFDGFLGSTGGSYAGQVQWQMAMHPRMSAIAPEVSGLGVAVNTAHLHMFANAYARTVGKGAEKQSLSTVELEQRILDETLSTGWFNEPLRKALPANLCAKFPAIGNMPLQTAQRWLWEHYCALQGSARANFVKEVSGKPQVTILEVESLPAVFGHTISHDAHTLPHTNPAQLCESLHAPVLMRTGWYDWGLNDALATWELLMRSMPASIRERSRLLIAPSAHVAPGYHEEFETHPELQHSHRTAENLELLMRWLEAVQKGTTDTWPRVIYYLMGAHEWRTADAWPLPEAEELSLFLGEAGTLGRSSPSGSSGPDAYVYDPADPTPTVGGSIVSYVYPPGSVDVSHVQLRDDVLVYSTEPLERDLDVVGPLHMVLFASSSAIDTDFVVRLSDVFPDGRAIQLQNGLLRARYRNLGGEPKLLEPGCVYRFEIDMWATANRFKAGHQLRVDISSSDFPRLDRNSNLAGTSAGSIPARQAIWRDRDHPSHLRLQVLASR